MTIIIPILIGGIALELLILTGLLLLARHTRQAITPTEAHHQPKDDTQ